MTDEKIAQVANKVGLVVDCYHPLQLSDDSHGSSATGRCAHTLLQLVENEAAYIEAGFNRFFRKCQVEGWDIPNKFLTIPKNQTQEFFKYLKKALDGEKLHNTGEDNDTYGVYGCDVSITFSGSPEANSLVIPCHKTTMHALCNAFLSPTS